MHRPWPRRALAAILAIFTLLTTGVAGEGAHVCPVHDAALAGAVAASARAHAANAAHGEHEHRGSDDGHSAERCCCVGRVCVAPVVALPARPVRLAMAPVIAARAPTVARAARVPGASAYFIPFANGPPRSTPPARSA